MHATSRRSLNAVVVALVAAFVAAGLAVTMTRTGGQHTGDAAVRPAVPAHAVSGPRRAADLQAVLVDVPVAAGSPPVASVTLDARGAPTAPAPVPPASRGPPDLVVTVIT